MDSALIARPGNADIQLDLFQDYANNVKLYPMFQRFCAPGSLHSWLSGAATIFFVPAGAEAFRRDLPDANIQFLDTGHFALETHVDEIAEAMRIFLQSAHV